MQENSILDEELEAELLQYPLLEYAVLDAGEAAFEQRIRYVCEHECTQYNTSWSCPPAVGTVEECAARCNAFSHLFIFSTISEVRDITDLSETLATRLEHEEVTRKVAQLMRTHFGEVLTLSTESCVICQKCAWPEQPCRHPDKMFPCVESYGIVVSDLAEKAGMTFSNGQNIVTWFSVIFFGSV